jgi:hypothetical protein
VIKLISRLDLEMALKAQSTDISSPCQHFLLLGGPLSHRLGANSFF